MRKILVFGLLFCAASAEAQTRWIVGNTLFEEPPGVMMAGGRSYGPSRGNAPSPSPAPAVSAPAPRDTSVSDGRGEASFQTVPGGSVIIVPPTAQVQQQQAPAPRVAECPDCGNETVFTVPVQLRIRTAVQTQGPHIQRQSQCPQ